MELIEILRAVIAFILVLFLPGFIWSYVFFKREEIDALERLAISFGLSVAIVPLIVFMLNKYFGIKITAFNSFLIIIILCVIGIVLVLEIELNGQD